MPATTSFIVRTIRENDLDDIMRIQAQCYPPSMQEPGDVVLSRIRAAGDTSLVAVDESTVGYVFAYRSVLGKASRLDSRFDVASGGDTLYIHDLAISPAAAGKGLAGRLVAWLAGLAQSMRLTHSGLVSVQDSQAFWERHGYRVMSAPDAHLRSALATYSGDACYMTRRLAP